MRLPERKRKKERQRGKIKRRQLTNKYQKLTEKEFTKYLEG